jgi:hypothetical protein
LRCLPYGPYRENGPPGADMRTFVGMVQSYDTLSQAVNGLQARGYVDELSLREECVVCNGSSTALHPEEFTIDEFHRFEGDTNPSDESIVYAIRSEKHGVKGILVNAYGPDASALNQAMVAKLATHPPDRP